MARKKNRPDKLNELLSSFDDSLLADQVSPVFSDNSIKVQRILLEMIRPDPIQPRRILPDAIHHKFHNGQLTPTQSLRELVQLAQVSARQNARPFSNVVELLPDPEKDDDQPENLSPEEATLRDLVHLAITVRDDGQVNPLTVVDVSEGVVQQYRIETGERRYWAAWILRDFIPGYDSDGMIDCIEVPAEQSSVFRQAKENTARKGLTAIAMARQAALLLLTVHGFEIPTHTVTNDFYRQALDLTLRGKREFTDAILSAMGGITRQRLSQYKLLLALSDEAWELADRHNLDERVLRYVLELPLEDQFEMMQQIVQFGLTSKQVKSIVSNADEQTEQSNHETPLDRFVRVSVKAVETHQPAEFAQSIVTQHGDVEMAFAYLNRFEKFIKAAKESLQ